MTQSFNHSVALEGIERSFRAVAPRVEFWSVRIVEERAESLSVRRNVVQPAGTSADVGVMITVIDGGGTGYAATCDLTPAGLQSAAERATRWAHQTAGCGAVDVSALPRPSAAG